MIKIVQVSVVFSVIFSSFSVDSAFGEEHNSTVMYMDKGSFQPGSASGGGK